MKNRSKMMLGALALMAVSGAAMAQPLVMEYDVDALGPTQFQYTFKVTVDDTLGFWSPGMGWNWLNFGSGVRSTAFPTSPNFQVTSPSPFGIEPPAGQTVGPWWNMSSVGGGHNGPQFGPVSLTGGIANFWIPTAVGETLEWTGNTTRYIPEGKLTWATVTTTGGAQAVSRRAATRVPAGPIGACCIGDGTCMEISETGCMNVGGVFGGNGSTCAGTPCTPPTGACCRDSGCVILNAVLCANTGGTYMGDNTECATAGCAPAGPFTLTPPDFTAASRVWTYAPSYSQVISGAGFTASGLAIKAHAAWANEAQQNDLLVEIVSPTGVTLLLGGDGTNPLVAGSVRWTDIRTSGTGPAANGNPATFNGNYSWDFGPADGEWTVNFWNNYLVSGSPVDSEIFWNNVSIEILDLGTGACCMADSTCTITARGNCDFMGGIFRGDNTTCATAECTLFLATETAPRFAPNATLIPGQFLDLTAHTDLSVIQIDYSASVANGQATELEIWTTPQSYVGFDADPSAWTLHDTLLGTSAGGGNMTSRELNVPLDIAENQTIGILLLARAGGIRNETGTQMWSNSDLSLFSALQRSEPWAGTTTVRVFGGRIHYTTDVTPACYANCDNSTTAPILNVDDFTCFINEFASAQNLPHEQQVAHYANCDGSTTAPALNVDDFTCFINAFAAGCP